MVKLPGGYAVMADTHCFILGKPRTRTKKDGTTEEYMDCATYHGTFAQALMACMRLHQRKAVADDGDMTLAEALEKMEKIERRFAKYAGEG